MIYWEIIAHNLSKAGWSCGYVSATDSIGRQSGLLTHIAATVSVAPSRRPSSGAFRSRCLFYRKRELHRRVRR
jgi:hypothetical protein